MKRALLLSATLAGLALAGPASAAPSLELGEVHVPDSQRESLPTMVAVAKAEIGRTPDAPRGAAARSVSLSLVTLDRGNGKVRCVVSAAVRDPKGRLLGAAQGNATADAAAPSAALERAVLAAAVRSALSGAQTVK